MISSSAAANMAALREKLIGEGIDASVIDRSAGRGSSRAGFVGRCPECQPVVPMLRRLQRLPVRFFPAPAA